MKLCVFAQCYNELSKGNLLRWLNHVWCYADLVAVYDDGSTDGSAELLEAEFDTFTGEVAEARSAWIAQGRPDTGDGPVDCYRTGRVPPIHGKDGTSLRVELDDLMESSVHIHFRSQREEVSVREFIEYATAIKQAHRELRRVLDGG